MIKPMGKSRKIPPTISIGVICHLGKSTQPQWLSPLRQGHAEARTIPGEGLNGTIIAPLPSPGDDLIVGKKACYGTGTVRLPPCNPHPNGVHDSLSPARPAVGWVAFVIIK